VIWPVRKLDAALLVVWEEIDQPRVVIQVEAAVFQRVVEV